ARAVVHLHGRAPTTPSRSSITAGTAWPARPSQRIATIRNQPKKKAAGRNVITPTASATTHVRNGGASALRMAQAPAYARRNAGDAAASRAIRAPIDPVDSTWSARAT